MYKNRIDEIFSSASFVSSSDSADAAFLTPSTVCLWLSNHLYTLLLQTKDILANPLFIN